MNRFFATMVATLFGFGYTPLAPGTVGSAVTMPLIIFLAYFYGLWGIAITTILFFCLGIYSIPIFTQGSREHDPGCVVIDEAMGQCCTFIPLAPHFFNTLNPDTYTLYFLGFFFFRFFDALKPQPARWADRSVHNAWGVMLDDLFAGIYASIALYVFYQIFWI